MAKSFLLNNYNILLVLYYFPVCEKYHSCVAILIHIAVVNICLFDAGSSPGETVEKWDFSILTIEEQNIL